MRIVTPRVPNSLKHACHGRDLGRGPRCRCGAFATLSHLPHNEIHCHSRNFASDPEHSANHPLPTPTVLGLAGPATAARERQQLGFAAGGSIAWTSSLKGHPPPPLFRICPRASLTLSCTRPAHGSVDTQGRAGQHGAQRQQLRPRARYSGELPAERASCQRGLSEGQQRAALGTASSRELGAPQVPRRGAAALLLLALSLPLQVRLDLPPSQPPLLCLSKLRSRALEKNPLLSRSHGTYRMLYATAHVSTSGPCLLKKVVCRCVQEPPPDSTVIQGCRCVQVPPPD